MPRNPVTALRWVSLAEATSFLVLLVATLAKYAGPKDEIGVQVIGPVHGVLFLCYVGLALVVAVRRRWSPVRTVLVLAASALPVMPFLVERTWLRQQERADARRQPVSAAAGA